MPYTEGDITIPDEERTPCEVWDRVMGYFRPIDNWNVGKQQEFEDRKRYKERYEITDYQTAAS